MNPLFSSNMWYEHYFSLWDVIEEDISVLNGTLFLSVLGHLMEFIKTSYNKVVEEIPTAALFTGINMPDHEVQFDSLSKELKKTTTPHVAYLQSEDCQNIKYLMENMIPQFVNEKEGDWEEDELLTTEKLHIKKNQVNLSLLQCWYDYLYKATDKKKPLVVIIPDFESFNPYVLQTFIMIISSYINLLPFILIFGIATDINTLHKSLPYKVSSKMRVKLFHSQKSVEYLNNILEQVFFNGICPFHLGGKVFNLFIEIFLFYDLSVNNFIQNMKFALADHFTNGNTMSLCHLSPYVIEETIVQFSHEEFESLKQLPSFKKLLENEPQEKQIKLLIDDDYFSKFLYEEICKIQSYIKRFHLFLKYLTIFVEDLPRAPLGKKVRELYGVAASKNITQTADYKECMKLLGFQSRDELETKLSKVLELISLQNNDDDDYDDIIQFARLLQKYQKHLNNIEKYELEEDIIEEGEADKPIELKSANRKQFKEKLLGMTKTPNKALNRYERLREEIIKIISQTFEKHLKEPESYCFHEIFFYNNMSIKNYIIGSHRAAIHNALHDPYFYLKCDCCDTQNSASIKPTMPDICIAFKLHLEYGKMINLFDWLQSFISVVDPDVHMDDDASKIVVKPEMQARFTQAVAELELLGFIKSSKRKADHVQRLTWGG